MTNSGLRTVDYATGRSSRVDVAVRRAVMTGVSQITGKINERTAKELGTDYFEVDWHANARPSHREWQGKVYSKEELETVCGLHTVTGLCGANCRHSYYAFVPGASKRMYPDEWLEEQNRREAETKAWQGKEYDAYGRTQKQRQMETAMRAQREKVQLLKDSGADKDEVMLARCKYQAQLNEYSRYCKKMKLPEQRQRIYYDMRGRVAPGKETMGRFPREMIKNAEKDIKQYEKYKNIVGKEVGSLANFGEIKYNNLEKYAILVKKAETYSEINKKEWAEEFKQKSKEAYDRFAKEDIYLSTHALSRLPRLNKKGYTEVSEEHVIDILKGKPNYMEDDKKIVYFDSGLQLSIIQNKETGDIVSIVRRKNPKEGWRNV